MGEAVSFAPAKIPVPVPPWVVGVRGLICYCVTGCQIGYLRGHIPGLAAFGQVFSGPRSGPEESLARAHPEMGPPPRLG